MVRYRCDGWMDRQAVGFSALYSRYGIYVYLDSGCHDEQNGVQRFVLRSKIAKLW